MGPSFVHNLIFRRAAVVLARPILTRVLYSLIPLLIARLSDTRSHRRPSITRGDVNFQDERKLKEGARRKGNRL